MMDSVPEGRWIVRADVAGTALFAASAGAALATDTWTEGSIAVAVALFALGIFAFIWGYFSAVERSRTEEIGVANLFLLTGRTAPPRVKRTMLAVLAAQVAVGLGAAAAGFSGLQEDDLNPFAFGILVPMFGLGLNGIWSSRHGAFGPRIVKRRVTPRDHVPPPDHEMEQNAHHG
jgi:hypothetical protein